MSLLHSTIELAKKNNFANTNKQTLRKISGYFILPFISNDLRELATFFGTDKWNYHQYAKHYQDHFYNLRNKKLNILEIGIGGNEDPNQGGGSLKMWKAYFPKSTIYGIDLYDKKSFEEDRIKIFQGSQDDESFLKEVVEISGGFDIIVDDGSHINEHVIKTFNVLFPLLNPGGIYVVEDTQTSYWENYGGDNKNLNNPKTMMNMFKNLVDCLNYQEFSNSEYIPTYFDEHIVAMHFYHNLVMLYKA